MVAVLDQFEVEYKESYTSGSQDQVVMGQMFYQTTVFGEKKYSYGQRGVVYGSINSDQAPTPGTSVFDRTNSRSYRSQPYREKAGNCRSQKHKCALERIYDTLTPDPISCFRINGADISILESLRNPSYSGPGDLNSATGVQIRSNALIMLDSAAPSGSRASNLNPAVDVDWTRSFPFEARYNNLQRKQTQQFKNSLEAKYAIWFRNQVMTTFSRRRKVPGSLFIGTVGKNNVLKNITNGNEELVTSWKHHWACDMDVEATNSYGVHITSSCGDSDILKVLFGYGDANTIFYTASYTNSGSSNGYQMLGTNKWPEFRVIERTGDGIGTTFYDDLTGSLWCASPIIRGWKYGLHNALPDYSSAYYRQNRYGQFRDMLEQRFYTKFFQEKSNELGFRGGITDAPVTVKFFDDTGTLTDPSNTQSQNLSVEATSSLPFFDGEQRNRSD